MKDEKRKLNRREFLKNSTKYLGGIGLFLFAGQGGSLLASVLNEKSSDPGFEYDPFKYDYIYLIDITKCIGCGACVRACEKENDVPKHYFRTWVERYQISPTGHVEVNSPNGGRDGFGPTVTGSKISKAFFVPKLCNHCKSTPCVQLCPVGASYRSPDGVVLVDQKICIGCGYCVQACPYGSRFIHPKKHVASKCTLCYHRITKNMQTACIQACPVRARRLGNMKKTDDEVFKIIGTEDVHILKPELLTDPHCYYVGLSMEVF
jgi:Fe-S-cluster-containing dehydrogenase component